MQFGRSSFAMAAGRIYQLYLVPHQLDTALSYYNQAIAWNEFFSPIEKANLHMFLGEVYRGLRPKFTNAQVLSELQLALELDPHSYWTRLSLGSLYTELKNPARAENYIREAIALLPESPYGYLYLGDLYNQQNNLAQAAAAYQQALDRQPGWQSAIDRLAAVRAKMEQPAP